jgi:hypothetical protein
MNTVITSKASLSLVRNCGADPATAISTGKLEVLRDFTIGDVPKKSLLRLVQKDNRVTVDAEGIFYKPDFTVLERQQVIRTIILTVRDFGFREKPKTAELLNPARLLQWSWKNQHRLPEGYVLEMLRAEAGPHIRLQYDDQPIGQILRMAMQGVMVSREELHVFVVGNHGKIKCLSTTLALPETEWPHAYSVVFGLRKVS